jgi:sterol desaturase/sphingolipid hydroxylase (fatty acid hydroxylase superfamily)
MMLPLASLAELRVGPILTVGGILVTMALVAWIETAIPLHTRGRWNRAHLGPNLALTFLGFTTNALFNGALLMALGWLDHERFGFMHLVALRPAISLAVTVLMLDFGFYVAHVALHKVPGFWRFHQVHHSDPAVDVTTTIRQHPGESVIRYAFLAAFAVVLGASPAAFGVYLLCSALNGLLEHANVRVPPWLDSLLSLITTWPNMHKVHHSRVATETDTNYGNLFSFWDRIFLTFTRARNGTNIVYGLDGFDDAAKQSTAGLLAMPFCHTGRENPAARQGLASR